MNKKAIIFDLDENLRKLRFNTDYSKVIGVTLRPHINELLKKLQEVKQEGIDPIICTTANAESAQKYFIDILPEEYRDVFVQIYSKENPIKPKDGSIEDIVYMGRNKPITALEDYDQILFFDDNNTEANYLKKVFENENIAPNKQVVFSDLCFDAPRPEIVYAMKQISKVNTEVAEKTKEFFDVCLAEPGCQFMIDEIEQFRNMPFEKGLIHHSGKENMKEYNSCFHSSERQVSKLLKEYSKELYYDYTKKYYEIIDSTESPDKDIGEI